MSNRNLRETIKEARSLGVEIRQRHGTGEIVFHHPSWGRVITVNRRRKDAPKLLQAFVRRLHKRRSAR